MSYAYASVDDGEDNSGEIAKLAAELQEAVNSAIKDENEFVKLLVTSGYQSPGMPRDYDGVLSRIGDEINRLDELREEIKEKYDGLDYYTNPIHELATSIEELGGDPNELVPNLSDVY